MTALPQPLSQQRKGQRAYDCGQCQEHRLNRAFQLLERVAEFCDKRQLVSVNRSLLSIAVDVADISRAVSSLDKRPASGQPFPNNTGTSGAGK